MEFKQNDTGSIPMSFVKHSLMNYPKGTFFTVQFLGYSSEVWGVFIENLIFILHQKQYRFRRLIRWLGVLHRL